jgi:hypothetical protein
MAQPGTYFASVKSDVSLGSPCCVRCESFRGVPARESRLVEQVSIGAREGVEVGVVAGINSLRDQRQESDRNGLMKCPRLSHSCGHGSQRR